MRPSGPSLHALGAGLRPDPGPLWRNRILVAVVVTRQYHRPGWGRRIVRAAYPGREWSIMQIVPGDLASGFFDRLGFGRDDLTQLEMRPKL